MGDLLGETIDHIEDTLGQVTEVNPWECSTSVPFYLVDRYQFYTANLLGRASLLVLRLDPEGETPATVKKQLQTIADHFPGDVVYVARHITTYNRKRLIEQRVPFVVPRKQIYLPGFGIDLREQFANSKEGKRDRLGAAAQLLVLREIFQGDTTVRQLGEWAELLAYSAMTISRAIDELAANDLVRVQRTGRSKYIEFPLAGKELWDSAKSLMVTPVKKVMWVKDGRGFEAPDAGETALAHYTMLSAPRHRTVALYDRDWSAVKQSAGLEECHISDEGDIQIERWRYNPRLVKAGPVVDELSLWLSLQDHDDDRVSIAADELLEQVPW